MTNFFKSLKSLVTLLQKDNNKWLFRDGVYEIGRLLTTKKILCSIDSFEDSVVYYIPSERLSVILTPTVVGTIDTIKITNMAECDYANSVVTIARYYNIDIFSLLKEMGRDEINAAKECCAIINQLTAKDAIKEAKLVVDTFFETEKFDNSIYPDSLSKFKKLFGESFDFNHITIIRDIFFCSIYLRIKREKYISFPKISVINGILTENGWEYGYVSDEIQDIYSDFRKQSVRQLIN